MARIWLMARFEARSHLGRRSFWLTTFVLPAAVVIVFLFLQGFTGGGDTSSPLPGLGTSSGPVGYVDPSGLLQTPPQNLPPGAVSGFENEQEAREALGRGEIERFYLLPEDYVASGRLTVVQRRYQPLRALEGNDLINYVINTSIGGDPTLAALLVDPTPSLTSTARAPSGPRASGEAAGIHLLPYLLMFILYLALAMTSGFMLQSVSREKENRTAEMLLVSLPPRQMMLGKILGLSGVGLLQVAIWLAAFFGVLRSGQGLLGIDVQLDGQLAANVIPWTVGYFLLGYLMYSSVYATLGVLAPTARDANHYVYVAIIPLVIPLLFNTTFGTAPNGALATTLSLVPFTSPIAMVARLGATSVPWWQTLAGLAALGVFAYGFVLVAARLFRAENILSSRALTWARFRNELLPQTAGTSPWARGQRAGLWRQEGGRAEGRVARDLSDERAARSREDGRRPAAGSRQRLFLMAAIAIALVVFGIVEYSRGDDSGIVMGVAGVIVAAAAYARYRRS